MRQRSFAVTALIALAVALGMMTVHLLLQRVEAGQLFLLACPWDQAATFPETTDARQTSRTFHVPALAAIAVIMLLLFSLTGRITRENGRRLQQRRWLLCFLILATAADLGTTLWFMHSRGIDHEAHPGIQLISAAFGRTVGPILGKLIQLAGLVAVGLAFPRWWPILAGVAAALFSLAAMHNAWLMIPPA